MLGVESHGRGAVLVMVTGRRRALTVKLFHLQVGGDEVKGLIVIKYKILTWKKSDWIFVCSNFAFSIQYLLWQPTEFFSKKIKSSHTRILFYTLYSLDIKMLTLFNHFLPSVGAFTTLPLVKILILPLAVFCKSVKQWCNVLLQTCEQHIGKPMAK